MKKVDNIYHTIYGINNCKNFFSKKHNFIIESVFINRDGLAYKNKSISKLLEITKYNVKLLNNKLFNSKFIYKHSQGIVINFKGKIEKQINYINKFNDTSCFIIADQIKDPQNLGQMIRTCECSGIDGIILPKHQSVHLTNSVLQVSQGAFLMIDVFIENNLVNVINYLKAEGFWVIGIENSIDAEQWYQMDYKGKIVIVVGSEGQGIRKLVKESCDFLATIPMKGTINSLNVTAALSAILFERQRQLDLSK